MTSTVTFSQAINSALREAMSHDERVLLLGEDVEDGQGGGAFRISKGLSTEFGTERVRGTPISEQAIIGAAIGAAIAGFRPVAEIMFMNFLTVCMDQLVNHAAKLRFMSGGRTTVPITVRCSTGVGVGFGGQHSDMLEAWFAHSPGLKVVTASNPADAKALLLAAIEDDDPTVYIESVPLYASKGPAPAEGYRVPLGKAAIAREGTDITVVGYGRSVIDALAVADELSQEGISVEIVDLRTIAPWDEQTVLNSVAKTNNAVVVHEAVRAFGVGAEISSRIHEELFGQLKGPVRRIGSRYGVVPFSPPLEKAFMYNREQIRSQIKKQLGQSS
jgi:acetoin:2,6-dichlorophenolindophenol oxidoreductase subunit beta